LECTCAASVGLFLFLTGQISFLVGLAVSGYLFLKHCAYFFYSSLATYSIYVDIVHLLNQALLLLRWLVAGLSTRRPRFVLNSVHVGFLVGEVALGV
jgi:hypothetical protein